MQIDYELWQNVRGLAHATALDDRAPQVLRDRAKALVPDLDRLPCSTEEEVARMLADREDAARTKMRQLLRHATLEYEHDRLARGWAHEPHEYLDSAGVPNPTKLAEDTAHALHLYAEDGATIPEEVFEWAMEEFDDHVEATGLEVNE